MPLTCKCISGEYDAPWYWMEPDDYSEMPKGNRRKRCASCGTLIEFDSVCVEITRTRPPKDDIEERIYGWENDAVPLASGYMCEVCSDLYFSLKELGFCVSPYENLKDLVKEYARWVQHEKEKDS